MARPTNEHHVHSDGYRSDQEVNVHAERVAEEVEDEIDNRVDPAHISDLRIEYGDEVCCTIDDMRAFETVEDVALDYTCEIERQFESGVPFDVRIHVG